MKQKTKKILSVCSILSLIFIVPFIYLTIINWWWNKWVMLFGLVLAIIIIWGVGIGNIIISKEEKQNE